MQEFSIDIYPPFTYSANHKHDCWEITLCLQGDGVFEINNEFYPYKPGFITCIPPGFMHRQIDKDTFSNICISAPSFLSNRIKENRVYCFQDDSNKSIETLMNLCHRVYQIKDANHENITDSLYMTIEHMLHSWNQSSAENINVEKLINKMISSFNDPELSLKTLLSESDYCNDHIRRIFKRETGMTPLSYLTTLRLNYAERLMSGMNSYSYSINDISLMSGFYDARYFSRIFKKRNNKTPSEYMRENMK